MSVACCLAGLPFVAKEEAEAEAEGTALVQALFHPELYGTRRAGGDDHAGDESDDGHHPADWLPLSRENPAHDAILTRNAIVATHT